MRTGTVTSISIIASAALGAALLGVLGTYLVLPEVAPSTAMTDTADGQAASAQDSTARRGAAQDSARQAVANGQADSTAQGRMTATKGSLQATGGEEMSATGGTDDSSDGEQLQALQDSIATLNRRLQDTRTAADTLRAKLADAEAEQAKVNELSNALMEMRRRNLGNLLTDVDMSVLKKLYQETTGQARTRLLQSMAPAQAAKFVNQVVEADSTSASLPESDS
jgi:hypothetical protein